MNNIESFYLRNGNFWIAYDGMQLDETVVLLLLEGRIAKLGKMFVAASYRGSEKGVASSLLATVVVWAQEVGVRAICLETILEPCAASEPPSVFKIYS